MTLNDEFVESLTEHEAEIYKTELAALHHSAQALELAKRAVLLHRRAVREIQSDDETSKVVSFDLDDVWMKCRDWAYSVTGLTVDESRKVRILAVVAFAKIVGRKQAGNFLNPGMGTRQVHNCFNVIEDFAEEMATVFARSFLG